MRASPVMSSIPLRSSLQSIAVHHATSMFCTHALFSVSRINLKQFRLPDFYVPSLTACQPGFLTLGIDFMAVLLSSSVLRRHPKSVLRLGRR